MWNDITAMVNWWLKNDKGTAKQIGNYGRVIPIAYNTGSSSWASGELAHIKGPLAPGANARPVEHQKYQPIFEIEPPSWHDKLADTFIVHKPIIGDGTSQILLPDLYPIKGKLVKPTDRYVMMDPIDNWAVRSADAGLFRVVGTIGTGDDTHLIVDTRVNQPIWRFQLKAGEFFSRGNSEKPGYLVRLDGDLYSDNVTISDPNKVGGNRGFCIQNGNSFNVISCANDRWVGYLSHSYRGVVPGFYVTFSYSLQGVPFEFGVEVYVYNIFKWNFGLVGATVGVEYDHVNNRYIGWQQEYICDDGRSLAAPPAPPGSFPYPPYPEYPV
jgi:hypothetical protein